MTISRCNGNGSDQKAGSLIDDVCLDDDELIAAFAQWLREAPRPDDWHRFALGANWDFVPPKLFEWIVLQQQCDKATALVLFWKSQPEYFLKFAGDANLLSPSEHEPFNLVQLIRERWQQGCYHRSELAFDREADAWPIDFEALERSHGPRVQLELPRSMRLDIEGRRLASDGCIDGIPARFWSGELR